MTGREIDAMCQEPTFDSGHGYVRLSPEPDLIGDICGVRSNIEQIFLCLSDPRCHQPHKRRGSSNI